MPMGRPSRKANPLLLVASSPRHDLPTLSVATTGIKHPPKVASSESLSSISLNTSNQDSYSSEKSSSPQANRSDKNNLKTFKTAGLNGCTYKQVMAEDGLVTCTMPRNLRHNLDQRPLNLPVNELYKR